MMQIQGWILIGPSGHHPYITPIQIRHSDIILPGISPEKLLSVIGNREGIRPSQTRVDQHVWIWSVHARFTDVNVRTPIRPVHVALEGIEGDGAWFFQALGDEDATVAAIEGGGFQSV